MLPQLIPADALVTVPLPTFDTLSCAVFKAKFAVQLMFAFIVTAPSVQSESPVQPVNTEPVPGVAVNTTTVAGEKVAVHTVPQSMPAGLLTTRPLALPPAVAWTATITLNVKEELRLKVAVTVVAALMVTVQVPVPVHPPPLHPVNVEPDAAAAVSTTDAPLL